MSLKSEEELVRVCLPDKINNNDHTCPCGGLWIFCYPLKNVSVVTFMAVSFHLDSGKWKATPFWIRASSLVEDEGQEENDDPDLHDLEEHLGDRGRLGASFPARIAGRVRQDGPGRLVVEKYACNWCEVRMSIIVYRFISTNGEKTLSSIFNELNLGIPG